eukprot:s859_g3.t1
MISDSPLQKTLCRRARTQLAMFRHFVLSALLLCATLFLAPAFVGTSPSVRERGNVAVNGRQGKRGGAGPRPKKMPRDITYTYVPYKRAGKKMESWFGTELWHPGSYQNGLDTKDAGNIRPANEPGAMTLIGFQAVNNVHVRLRHGPEWGFSKRLGGSC